VRCHLLTKNLLCWLLCFGLLGLNGIALAQVYKSYDADGNVIFSDKPTKRSSEVEVTKPNLSDSFDIPPPTESPPENRPEAEPEPESEPVTQPNSDYDSADTNNDGRVSRREKEEQRKERHKKNREEAEAAEENEE
jgi:hypothetical protein